MLIAHTQARLLVPVGVPTDQQYLSVVGVPMKQRRRRLLVG
jgi:hypothetical protein